MDKTLEELKRENQWYENTYGPYIKERGLNNWKNLFRKPTLLEWTILFLLIMGGFAAWAYKTDINACFNNSCQICMQQKGGSFTQFNPLGINLTKTNLSILRGVNLTGKSGS